MTNKEKTLAGLILTAVVLVVCAVAAPQPKPVTPICFYVAYTMQGGSIGSTSMISKNGVVPTWEDIMLFADLVSKNNDNTKLVITSISPIVCSSAKP